MLTSSENNVEKTFPLNMPGAYYIQSLRKQSLMEQNEDAILLDMPVKAHIKKYLDKQVQGPLPISLTTTIGIFLYNVLRRQQTDSKFDKAVIKYPYLFPIQVSKSDVFDYGTRNITSYTVIQFNRLWDNELKYECYMHVNYSTRYRGIETKQAVEEFLDVYDFDDTELTYQTLIRHLSRIKSSEKKQTCPLLWASN